MADSTATRKRMGRPRVNPVQTLVCQNKACRRVFTETQKRPRKYCGRRCYYASQFGVTKSRDGAMGWSRKHERCIDCGTTERRHYGGGRCGRCYDKRLARIKRGTLGAACIICGEDRAVDAAHLVPRAEIGERWDEWLTVTLCPTHHKVFDMGRCTPDEMSILKPLIDHARWRLAEEKRCG